MRGERGMRERHVDLPAGTPGNYVRTVGLVRARLRDRLEATNASIAKTLSDLLDEIASRATESCRIDIATVRPAIATDVAVIASLEDLMLEVVGDLPGGADTDDVAFAQSLCVALAGASVGPVSPAEESIDDRGQERLDSRPQTVPHEVPGRDLVRD